MNEQRRPAKSAAAITSPAAKVTTAATREPLEDVERELGGERVNADGRGR
jgi:hypothetical protein